jgi:carbon monoxide dehydrogenase subunit G
MAEQLINEFTVNQPIDTAWPVICDLERIAPCLPGAQLQEIEGDEYRGVVKVKLGAVATQFKGSARMIERDDTKHTAKLKAEGRDTGGRGNAAAEISASATALSPTSTRVEVIADLHITGKVAQFGRGIMADVSKKLMSQFAQNLNSMLDAGSAETAATNSSGNAPASTGPGTGETAAAGTATSGAPADTGGVRKIDGPASEPIDMAGMAGPAIAKRVVPVAVLALLLLLLLRRRRG